MMNLTYAESAQRFVNEETQFHLGDLVTEQPHPATVGLAETLQADTAAGIRMLQRVDRDVTRAAERFFAGAEFAEMERSFATALAAGRRIFFSGCGATGRLSILLEVAWRRFFERLQNAAPQTAKIFPAGADSVIGFMTGGDYALVRSVESFEDYQSFGRRQTQEAGVCAGDVFVGISEGGETSSVIGSVHAALATGAAAFFVFNNPARVLAQKILRSRSLIDDPRVTKLELASGPMAVAGSTRMQATTFELLAIGAALESAIATVLLRHASDQKLFESMGIAAHPPQYPPQFAALLAEMEKPDAVTAMRGLVEFEAALYKVSGFVTYFARDYLLDIFTDTTERSPTFMLPPFRKSDDIHAPVSWAFVKHPFYPTPEAWRHVLRRDPRCLTWNAEDYRKLGAPQRIIDAPPKLDAAELQKILIGNEPDASRLRPPHDAAVAVLVGEEMRCLADAADKWTQAFNACAQPFNKKAIFCLGPLPPQNAGFDACFYLPCTLPPSPLMLWHHLAIKLALNIVSTATMGCMGRLISNWMAFVDTTNKKLIDRGTRLVAELCGLNYADACRELHRTFEEVHRLPEAERKIVSAVARTIERCGRK